MASHGEDDLVASTTAGFKVGEKKTLAEYTKLGERYFIFSNSDDLWASGDLHNNLGAMASPKSDSAVSYYTMLPLRMRRE